MEIIERIEELRSQIKAWKKEGKTIGFVPTMGYLHEGHKSLIDRAVKENDKVVVSDFVNPMQFGPKEDLATYPRDLDMDAKLCKDAGVDIIFYPAAETMYKDSFSSFVDMNTLTKGLCGKTRPIHFRGVCTVLAKLFNIVTPDRAYFGQKDAQQLAVVKHMVEDLNFDIEIIGCPIIREKDGLAKSSRNTYLSKEQRESAVVLSKALKMGKEMIEAGEVNPQKVISTIEEEIKKVQGTKIDYVEIVTWPYLETATTTKGSILCALAVYFDKVRLIDNFIIEE
ncbi:MAG TPA: pantoate--beta-alanine ligase [Eubacterium sp.]|nr:pantoate--beta-alanine ligase [Eubacterium sp.]HAV90377.1 pantoate--beta-alanine ligase [Eubacterium sp.]